MFNNNLVLQRAVRASLAGAAMAAVLPSAFADTAAPSSTTLEDIVVTGSRIKTVNDVSISPVQSITATEIQETGLSRVEDILNQMPAVFAGQNSNVSNGADGTATVNLRGLGPQRTLVLVNGRRLGPGTSDGRNYSDIDMVPSALVERVDVLTGGASSVYGADAVAGVVNFVLNTHYEGVRVDANYGFYSHTQSDNGVASVPAKVGDALPPSHVNTGFGKDLSFLAGSNFADGKGNATFYATYNQAAAVLQSQYDYSACTLNTASHGAIKCGGSLTSAGGTFIGYYNGGTIFDTLDKKTGNLRGVTGADRYNYGPLNYQQRPSERWTAGSFLNYDVNSNVNVYAEIMYMRNSTVAQIAPSGDFGNQALLNCSTNPFLQQGNFQSTLCAPNVVNNQYPGVPAGDVAVYILRRNVEGGPRTSSYTNSDLRLTIGAKGTINDAWTFDVSAQQSLVDTISANGNYLSNTRINLALQAVTDANGNVVCASGPPCVPWNIFAPGGVTQAALNYLSIPLIQTGNVTEQVVTGSVTGDLGKYGWKLPSADHGIQANIGAEYRNERMNFNPDEASQIGDAAGGSGDVLPLSGGFHVAEAFTELSIPLADNKPWAHAASAEVGYRYSAYTLGFNTDTYKVGLEWSPVKDIRWRGSYQRAVRAPNIGELFSSQIIGLDGTTDPCAGATSASLQALCIKTGVPAALYANGGAGPNPNPAGQYNGLLGGNPILKPEVADTYSTGIDFRPSAIPSLNIGVDYFNIKIKNVIGAIGANTILTECYFQGQSNYCDAIHRTPSGSLWLSNAGYVSDTNVNSGALATSGIDFNASYVLKTAGWGKVSFALTSTYLQSLTATPLPGGASYDCAGLYGNTCGASNPKIRSVLNTTWATPWKGLDLTMRWRYFGDASFDNSQSNPLLAGTYTPGYYTHIGSYSWVDLSGSMPIATGTSLRIGVNNIADKNPPIVLTGSGGACAGGCNGNTYPGVYDSLGRYIYAHVTVQF